MAQSGKEKPEEIVDTDAHALLKRLERGQANPKDLVLAAKIIKSWLYITGALSQKKASLKRLKKMLFGTKSSEKSKDVLPPPCALDSKGKAKDSSQKNEQNEPEGSGKKRKGHGRNSAAQYRGANHVCIEHPYLSSGDTCPQCKQGTVYETNEPGVIVKVTGQVPLAATVYTQQKLRCNLCAELFKAPLHQELITEKYDANAMCMISLLRYGFGMPNHRLQTLQASFQIPLPSSTQWDLIAKFSEPLMPIFECMIGIAAKGKLMHNDDTGARVLSIDKARKEQARAGNKNQRSGTFTTGIISVIEDIGNIALFITGEKHAGENLKGLLERRPVSCAPPIQMSDALSRNIPQGLQTILANCLVHGRRNFVDAVESFPKQCEHVLEVFRTLYQLEEKTQKLDDQKRLAFHQKHSACLMQEFHQWLQAQFDSKNVEPNSSLGQAINYMLKHWKKLTLFLSKPGAPLDNNICERALKVSIRHRSNSLFYKTQKGANIGDMFMSFIHTCALHQVNAFQYMTTIYKNAQHALASPHLSMPWNYNPAAQLNST